MQCKWVYRTNVYADVSDIKYKVSFVAKLFSKLHGVDYTNTFSPVAKMEFIKLVLVIVASKHWEVHHMDVKSAFIHGKIHEEIYMNHIEGFPFTFM